MRLRSREIWILAALGLAIPLAFVAQWAAGAVYVGVALMWLVPDQRIEKALAEAPDREDLE